MQTKKAWFLQVGTILLIQNEEDFLEKEVDFHLLHLPVSFNCSNFQEVP